MVGIIIGSHGKFAEGIKMSSEMIFGAQRNVEAVTLMPNEGPDDVRKKMEDAIAKFDDPKQVLFLIDLWGGTPFNQANGLIAGHEDTWAIVTGLNLPMLLEAYGARLDETATAQSIAKHIITTSREGIKPKPESLEPEEKAAAPAAAKGSAAPIPEGTVIGDGKIKIGLCRVDTRLLHGQVATTWTKQVNPDRIIVVSDAVAKDKLRKTMIVQAAPPGVHAHVIPVQKMIDVAHDTRFGGTKAMLLFENPQDVLRAVEGGVDIKTVNLGSMAYTKGKVVANQAIAMDQNDVDTLEALKKKGIKFDVRKVPSDSPENFDTLLNKAKTELKNQK
ncbi:MAG: mannose/fructose/sorbose PTS transporter subunit IIA [Solobacterium sp.]|jgi:PTS system mannose-specific IIB component|nr:mannose/fructose/sorbose PTS transporter subunit IIA [Solobacterium sp.]MCH4049889.1 mannose/fructose/sorbose PTS transporter subunit IIA [Solobacterium sp.]MCH4073574.1 mannose/fructose/sorbose PTS transporter subunit IIA [Solobacterium sp.]MCI1312945.1 mannose/fructose/sorbose PTS transporter subunit IIA [Solobacterium sp.]MCI1345971.1 mannose/fructose/sorbose PTS transporter subunit IIA [Solobacterium sp.]